MLIYDVRHGDKLSERSNLKPPTPGEVAPLGDGEGKKAMWQHKTKFSFTARALSVKAFKNMRLDTSPGVGGLV